MTTPVTGHVDLVLSSLIQQFEIVTTLKPGESLHIKDGQIAGKYEAGTTTLGRSVKFLQKKYYGDTAEHEIQALTKLITQAESKIKDLNKEVPTLDRFLVVDSRLAQLKHLKKLLHVVKHKQATSGIDNYRNTLLRSESRLTVRPTEETDRLVGQLDTLIGSTDALYQEIIAQVKKYKDLAAVKIPVTREVVALLLGNEKYPTPILSTSGVPKSLPADALKTVLKEIYGKRAVRDAFEFYGVSKLTHISTQDVNALLIALSANLTKEDLRHIHANRQKVLAMTNDACLSRLPEDFDSMSSKEIAKFAEEMRSSITEFKQKELLDHAQDRPYLPQLTKDLAFLRACQNIDNYTNQGKPFARELSKLFRADEYLAKEIVPALCQEPQARFSAGVIVPSLNEEREVIAEEALPLIHQDGISGVLILPVKDAESEIPRVIFRNVTDRDPQSVNRMGFHYVYSWTGATTEDKFDMHVEALLKSIQEHCKSDGDIFKVKLIGEGWGAFDAAKMTLNLVKNSSGSTEIQYVGFDSCTVTEEVDKELHAELLKRPAILFSAKHLEPASSSATKERVFLGSTNFNAHDVENAQFSLFRFNSPKSRSHALASLESTRTMSLGPSHEERQVAKDARILLVPGSAYNEIDVLSDVESDKKFMAGRQKIEGFLVTMQTVMENRSESCPVLSPTLEPIAFRRDKLEGAAPAVQTSSAAVVKVEEPLQVAAAPIPVPPLPPQSVQPVPPPPPPPPTTRAEPFPVTEALPPPPMPPRPKAGVPPAIESRANLLAQIRGGKALKKVEADDAPPQEDNSLAGIMQRQMAARRDALEKGGDSESDDENEESW